MSNPARNAAETYQRAVNSKDLDLLSSILSEDMTVCVPPGLLPGNPTGILHGKEAAMGFFSRTSFPEKAILSYTNVYEDGKTCVVELRGELPDRVVEVVDIFTVGEDGLLTRFAVYGRLI
jgi:hypothetical protein